MPYSLAWENLLINLYPYLVTVKDTQAIYAALIDPELCGYVNDQDHIQVLNNQETTKAKILESLKWLKEKAGKDSQATVFIYYSGHGWVDKTDNAYYLLQHDVKPSKLANSALSAKDFTEALRQIKAERLLVVIDSCHAAGMATSKDADIADAQLFEEFDNFQRLSPSKGLISALKQGKGRVVFTSSEGEQQSWIKDDSMSIYTFHFLEALQGGGNQPGDTEVNVSNLMNYLGKTVPKTAKDLYNVEQIPHFDFDTDDFAIALLCGGQGQFNIDKSLELPKVMTNHEIITPALAMARRSLAILEEQVAGFSKLQMPAHLRIELEEKRQEVAELEKRLRNS